MTATRIDYTNIYSAPSINIFTILDTRANIADPRDATGARKFVYNSDPFMKAIDNAGLPYIVCEDVIIDKPVTKSADAKHHVKSWSQTILVRTVKGGSSNTRTDAGITDMRTIMDSIFQTFDDSTIKQSLHDLNMYDIELSVTNVDTVLINQKSIHETTIDISYKTRLKVSV